MRINFRQGLLSFQKDSGSPVYLQPALTPGFITHVISPIPTAVTFAHGDADYLQTFDDTVTNAWGPVLPGVSNYLYWDVDLLTSDVTRGITTLIPISSLTTPVSPVNDQHWFDLTTNTMRVWSQAKNRWQPKVRVFAGTVVNGNTNVITMFSEGSQVGLVGPSNPGYIMLDSQLQPLRTSTGAFLTDDGAVRVRSTVGTSGVLVQPANRVVPVRAGESIPAMSLVYFSGADTVRLASSNPALLPARIPMGVITEPLVSGDVGNLVPFGEITYDQWDWSASPGAPLYCGDAGEITLARPQGLLAYRVGFVKNKTTVLLMVDAETYPQVYSASAAQLLVHGTTPVTVTDVVNGLGERVVTIGVPNSTALTPGLMTAAQFTQLGQHETRITSAEVNIATLQVTKANVIHTHPIADVLLLQPALDTLTASLLAKADKVVGAVSGHLAALNSAGNLTDSGYAPSAFALVAHTHTIPDVIGLQTALDQRALRNHLNAFNEVFQGVNRAGSTDVGVGLDLNAVLLLKSDVGHLHAIADVTGLVAALNNKIDVGTNFPISQIINLQTELNNRALVSHTHVPAAILGGTNGYVVMSNGTNGYWAPLPPSSGVNILDDLADVTITAPTVGQILRYTSYGWVNSDETVAAAYVPLLPTTTVSLGTVLA
jgi:hypothetical protein